MSTDPKKFIPFAFACGLVVAMVGLKLLGVL